jgi:hypothetical protein
VHNRSKTLDPHDDETRCDPLIALGEALIDGAESRRAFADIAPEAFTLAEARNTVTGRFGVTAKQLMGSFHSEHSPGYRCQSFVSGLNAQIGTLNQRRLIASKPTLRWLARNLLAVTTRKPGAC